MVRSIPMTTNTKKECEGNCPNVCKSHGGKYDFCVNEGCKCHSSTVQTHQCYDGCWEKHCPECGEFGHYKMCVQTPEWEDDFYFRFCHTEDGQVVWSNRWQANEAIEEIKSFIAENFIPKSHVQKVIEESRALWTNDTALTINETLNDLSNKLLK